MQNQPDPTSQVRSGAQHIESCGDSGAKVLLKVSGTGHIFLVAPNVALSVQLLRLCASNALH